MSQIVVNNNQPQQQCPGYVVVSGGAQIKFNNQKIDNTGSSKYGYGWVENGNSIASFGYTSCTGIITRHSNGRITLAHIPPAGYSSTQISAYKEWLTSTVGGTLQNMWLVGGKDSQDSSAFNSYKPNGYNNALTYIGPQRNILNNFRGLDVLCTAGVITLRCRPSNYARWSDGFETNGAVFTNGFQNAQGASFIGAVRKKDL